MQNQKILLQSIHSISILQNKLKNQIAKFLFQTYRKIIAEQLMH